MKKQVGFIHSAWSAIIVTNENYQLGFCRWLPPQGTDIGDGRMFGIFVTMIALHAL
mgnify:CR=1 FL=1